LWVESQKNSKNLVYRLINKKVILFGAQELCKYHEYITVLLFNDVYLYNTEQLQSRSWDYMIYRSLKIKEWWDYLTTVVIPGIIKTVSPILEGLGSLFGKVAKSINDNKDKLEPLFELFKTVGTFIFKTLGPVIGEVLGGAFKLLGSIISGLITLFATFVDKLKSIYDFIVKIVKGIKDAIGAVGNFLGLSGSPTSTGATSVPSGVPTGRGIGQASLGNNYNITVNGAIDSESTARQIVDILNQSTSRGTLGAAGFSV
jgi:hypothetical protein